MTQPRESDSAHPLAPYTNRKLAEAELWIVHARMWMMAQLAGHEDECRCEGCRLLDEPFRAVAL